MTTLARKVRLRQQAKANRLVSDRAAALARTGQVARTTVPVGEEDLPVTDAVQDATEAVETLEVVGDDVVRAGDDAYEAMITVEEARVELEETRTDLDERLTDAEEIVAAADGRITEAQSRADAAFGASKAGVALLGELFPNPAFVYGEDGLEGWAGTGGRVRSPQGTPLLVVGSDDGVYFAETMTRDIGYAIVEEGRTVELAVDGAQLGDSTCVVRLLDSASVVLAELSYTGIGRRSVRWTSQGQTIFRVRVHAVTTGAPLSLVQLASVSVRDVTGLARAEDAADAALTMAGTRTRVYYSTAAPTGEATENDVWRRQDPATRDILQEWRYTGTAWEETKVSSSAIANLDVGKLVVGSGVISDLVANHIAGRTAAFMELDVGKLIATSATLREAVVEKIWSEVVRTKFLTVTEKIITQDVIATGAIDGMTITGATVRGGTIEQFGDSASVGTHKHPTTTTAAPGWKDSGLGTMSVLTVTVGSSTRAVRASRTPAGTCAVTWDIPNVYAGAVIKVRMRVRRPQAGAAFLSGMTLPIGPEVQQVPANAWTTIETPEFLCTGDSWMTVGFYNTTWGDATEAEVIVVAPGTTTTTMENTSEYGPALVWRAGGETTAVYRSGSIALRSINPLPGGEHTMVLNSGGIRMNAGVGGGIDPLQFAKQLTTDTHLNIRADGHIRMRPGVGHEVVILERGHIVPGAESNFNRHIVFQQATGAITQIGSTGVYGKTLTAELPIVLDEFEWITLMPLSIGNGFGQAFLAGMTREATFTRVTYRFIQTGSNAQQTLTMLVSVIRQSPSIG